jgi:hypothetical protein
MTTEEVEQAKVELSPSERRTGQASGSQRSFLEGLKPCGNGPVTWELKLPPPRGRETVYGESRSP